MTHCFAPGSFWRVAHAPDARLHLPHLRGALHRNWVGNPVESATTAPSDCELCSAPSTPRCCAPTAPTFDSAASGVDRASAQLNFGYYAVAAPLRPVEFDAPPRSAYSADIAGVNDTPPHRPMRNAPR